MTEKDKLIQELRREIAQKENDIRVLKEKVHSLESLADHQRTTIDFFMSIDEQ